MPGFCSTVGGRRRCHNACPKIIEASTPRITLWGWGWNSTKAVVCYHKWGILDPRWDNVSLECMKIIRCRGDRGRGWSGRRRENPNGELPAAESEPEREGDACTPWGECTCNPELVKDWKSVGEATTGGGKELNWVGEMVESGNDSDGELGKVSVEEFWLEWPIIEKIAAVWASRARPPKMSWCATLVSPKSESGQFAKGLEKNINRHISPRFWGELGLNLGSRIDRYVGVRAEMVICRSLRERTCT
ncbi:hypothetical protein B0H11DRAFT_1901519 [Mycena galericulata]|nr:hypothetical protein B0H11DRAFT_1931428 [Mycena galericulata]KAJ7509398.1 hypothetical protein B0H11DRAFT_1901519 [Mycena galericulata]